MPRSWLTTFKSAFRRIDAHTIYLYAIAVGVLTGLAAVLFFLTTHWLSHILFNDKAAWPLGEWDRGVDGLGLSRTAIAILLVAPTLGGLAVGLIARLWAPEVSGSGIDVFLDSFHKQSGDMKRRTPFLKLLASVATIGTGGSTGKEGPMALIGAGIGSFCGGFLKMGARTRRTLLLAGAAGGLGAIFRAPLGGALVAVEVLYEEDFEADALVPCIISSVTAYTLFSGILGFGHNLKFQTTIFHSPAELIFFIFLGLFCSLGGYLFVRLFDATKMVFSRLPLPSYLRPALGGLMVGIVGLLVPQSIGEGLGVMQASIDGAGAGLWHTTVLIFLGLALLKMLTTSLTVQSGGSGGALIPSLFIGASLGVAFGTLVHQIFPNVSPDIVPYAVVGMASFFSAVTNASLGALVMVTELTGGYELLPALMLVACVSLIVSRHWSLYKNQPRNKFTSPAHLGDMNPALLKHSKLQLVFQGVYPRQAVISDRTPLADIEEIASKTGETDYVVVDEKGNLSGLFSFRDITIPPEEWPSLRSVVVAQELATREIFFVTKDDSLLDVLRILHGADFDKVPVVEHRGEENAVLGYLRDKDILKYYHSLGMKKEADGFAF